MWRSWSRLVARAVERRVDKHLLHDVWSQEQVLPGVGSPRTACEVHAVAWRFVRRLESRPACKWIAATDGLERNGTARRWELGFELPVRRAQMVVVWSLAIPPNGARASRALLEGHAVPYSEPLDCRRRMPTGPAVSWSACRQERARAWEEERRRTPDLPVRFLDSPEVLLRLRRKGVDPFGDGVSLTTGQDENGTPVWIAASRSQTLREPFAI